MISTSASVSPSAPSRDDLPSHFSRNLNVGVYRGSITSVDPLNTFHGIENYKTIFWALRFHTCSNSVPGDRPGDILCLAPDVDTDPMGATWVSWMLWEARGMIHEHKVDNMAFNSHGRCGWLPCLTWLPCPATPSPAVLSDPMVNAVCPPGWSSTGW